MQLRYDCAGNRGDFALDRSALGASRHQPHLADDAGAFRTRVVESTHNRKSAVSFVDFPILRQRVATSCAVARRVSECVAFWTRCVASYCPVLQDELRSNTVRRAARMRPDRLLVCRRCSRSRGNCCSPTAAQSSSSIRHGRTLAPARARSPLRCDHSHLGRADRLHWHWLAARGPWQERRELRTRLHEGAEIVMPLGKGIAGGVPLTGVRKSPLRVPRRCP